MRTSSLLEGWSTQPRQSRLSGKPPQKIAQLTGDDNDTGLAGDALGGPRKVAGVETQSAVLVVTAAGADGVDALGTDTRVRGLAARLEGSLLPCHAVRKIKDLPKRDTGSEREGSVPAGVSPERNVDRHLPSGPSSIVLFRGGGHTVVTADTLKLAKERREVKVSGGGRGRNLRSLGTRVGALVPRVSGDTHLVEVWGSKLIPGGRGWRRWRGGSPQLVVGGWVVGWSVVGVRDSKRAIDFGKCGRKV